MGRLALAAAVIAFIAFTSMPGSVAAFTQLETLEVESVQGGKVTTVTELQNEENTIIIENGSAKVLSYGVGSRNF